MATTGPRLEAALERFSEMSGYLGDEIVVSAAMEGREPSLLVVGEVRKPGLKPFLQQLVKEYAAPSKTDVRVLDPQELATAKDTKPATGLVVLVRADVVAAAADVATLRRFNARLDQGSREFDSTPFGQRVLQAYQGGASILGAADLQRILAQVPPPNKQDQAMLQRTGLLDVWYVVWEHKSVTGQPVSQAELCFSAPRHGIASWLAAPAPLGSLDFVSSSAILAATFMLKNPADIFQDVKELSASPGPNPVDGLAQSMQALHIDLQEDLLRPLSGEVTLEIDSMTPPEPVWKAILRVNDPIRLQQAVETLLASSNLVPQLSHDGDISYYTLRIPSGNRTNQIAYTLVDGYLVVASNPAMAAEAVRLHRTGASLGKSRKFMAALPPGQPTGASALLYEDPMAVSVIQLQRMWPDLAASVAQSAAEVPPLVITAYGEQTAIREASSSGAADFGVVGVMAALAIPNLLRSRTAANEASAVGALRTVNTAQVIYAASYPEKGFAPSLETLGLNPRSPDATSEHAAILDSTLGCADMWCTRDGYRFTITAACREQSCRDYVIVATPLSASSGSRNFCSTSDGVIHFKAGLPLNAPPTATECRTWAPLQ